MGQQQLLMVPDFTLQFVVQANGAAMWITIAAVALWAAMAYVVGRTWRE